MCKKSSSILSGIQIGSHSVTLPLALAPMAGITDLPFRRRHHGH